MERTGAKEEKQEQNEGQQEQGTNLGAALCVERVLMIARGAALRWMDGLGHANSVECVPEAGEA